MKKIFALIAVFTTFCVIGAPVMNEKEIKRCQDGYATATGNEKFYMGTVIELAKKENAVESFSALQTFVTNYAKQQKITDKVTINSTISRASLFLFVGDKNIHTVEAYEFAKTHRLVMRQIQFLKLNAIKFNSARRFEEFYEIFKSARVDYAGKIWFIRSFPIFIQECSKVDEEKAKAALQYLNRIYSPYLLKDRTNWEPIVAQIRVALETY